MKRLIEFVEKWLSDNNVHLATHNGANYHYLTSNDFDYTGYSSFQSSIEEAIEDESIYVDKDDNLHICEKIINLKNTHVEIDGYNESLQSAIENESPEC